MIKTALIAASLAGIVALPVADGPPRFNIEQSCSEAGEPAVGADRSNQVCRDDERRAEASLQRRWNSFPVLNRGPCVASAELVGPPSYVQVLTCLELATPR